MTPDNKSRIKIKEIFNHPWVMEFEKQYKEEKIKAMTNNKDVSESNNLSISNISTSNNSNNLNKLPEPVIKEALFDNKSSKNNNNDPNIDKNKIIIKNEKTISEKIDEKLNNKNKIETNLISSHDKNGLIDLNEIENKLNKSINKHKDFKNISINDGDSIRKKSNF